LKRRLVVVLALGLLAACVWWGSAFERNAEQAKTRSEVKNPGGGVIPAGTKRPYKLPSQPIPDEIKVPDAPKTARRIDAFRSLSRTMRMADVVHKCGLPDEHQGSGIFIFVYYLDDGTTVMIGTPDLKELFYVRHFDKLGKSTSLIPEIGDPK
jgi:hypothetical protein